MKQNKMKVIRLNRSAIEELLFEYIMENAAPRFKEREEDTGMRHMVWDYDKTGDLVYVLTPDRRHPELNFDKILADIPLTADSIFSETPYVEVDLAAYTESDRTDRILSLGDD